MLRTGSVVHGPVLSVSRRPSEELMVPLWSLLRVADEGCEAEGSMGQPGTKTARQ